MIYLVTVNRYCTGRDELKNPQADLLPNLLFSGPSSNVGNILAGIRAMRVGFCKNRTHIVE